MFPFGKDLEVAPGFFQPFDRVWSRLSPLLTPERRERITEVVASRCFSVVPVIENLHDRGNVSAVLRSAEAFGLGSVHLIESQRTKESQRTSAGADKWVEIRRWSSARDCIEALKAENQRILVTSLRSGSVAPSEIDFGRPSALVFGNEKEGASQTFLDAADAFVRIPMYGFVQSFNISVAAAICFSQLVQDRIRRFGKHGDLDDTQQAILRAVYALRTLESGAEILRSENP